MGVVPVLDALAMSSAVVVVTARGRRPDVVDGVRVAARGAEDRLASAARSHEKMLSPPGARACRATSVTCREVPGKPPA